jgi:hypothetical protein
MTPLGVIAREIRPNSNIAPQSKILDLDETYPIL